MDHPEQSIFGGFMPVGDVLVCTILGAAVLAIILLGAACRRHERSIQQLHAELTAQRIAALTAAPLPAEAAASDAPTPARQKRHLALYIGGGAIAAFSFLGNKLRSLSRGHTAAVTASAAVIVGTAAATALYLTSGTGTARGTPQGPPTRPSPSASDTAPTTDEPYGNDAIGHEPEGPPVALLPLDADASRPITEPLGPSPGGTGAVNDGEKQAASPADDTTPTPAPPSGASSPPTPAPAPTPSVSPTAPDGGLCVHLHPVLDLCLF